MTARHDTWRDVETTGRLLVGQETPPCDSPCPGCGAYYFTPHELGCEYEQCAVCGAALVDCEGHAEDAYPTAQNPS